MEVREGYISFAEQEAHIDALLAKLNTSTVKRYAKRGFTPSSVHDRGLEVGMLSQPAFWALSDQERLLTELLRPSVGARLSRQVAHSLMIKFGSLPHVLSAPRRLLKEVDLIGEGVANQLALVFEIAIGLAKKRVDTGRVALGGYDAMVEYLHVSMAYHKKQEFRVIFLDAQYRFIADEVMQRGDVRFVSVFPREIIRRALELSASNMILVHNHPHGDPRPGAYQIRQTRDIVSLARALGMTVVDHLVIGSKGTASLRRLKLL